jgi:hypothetical protein
MKHIIMVVLWMSLLGHHAIGQHQSQPISEFDASDPGTMKSRVTTDFETYFFVADAKYYALRLGYEYGIQNERHLFGISLPLVHNIFMADYGGYENTTGVGDIEMRYVFVPYLKTDNSSFQRVSIYFEMTAPTGTAELGRGTGTWVYKPGMIFTFRPNPFVAFYPEVKYSFSTKEANGLGGDGAPDQSDPDVDGFIKNLSIAVPAVALVTDWRGWVGMNATYIQSFSEDTYYLFLRLDFGKMIGKKTSGAIQVTKFIAGQPRLDALVQVKFQFFIR